MSIDESVYRILVVEDNPGDYLLVEDYLEEHIKRPELVHAKCFKEAQKLLESPGIPFDIILLDLSLPDVAREELIHKTSSIGHMAPVIILTGYSDLHFATKSLALGVSDYLVKDTISSLMLYKSIIYAIERFRFLQSLRESEKRYMDLFHLSPEPMWVYDVNNNVFLDVNDAAIRQYGYTEQEFLRMKLHDLRPTDDGKLAIRAATNFEHLPKIQPREITKHQKKDGSVIFVETIRNNISFNGMHAEIVLATDITEKILQINAIQEQNKKLKEIAWTQSHIMRAPVARLMSLIDLMKSGQLTADEQQEFLGHVVQSAQEIDSIIIDIVNKSQLVIEKADDQEELSAFLLANIAQKGSQLPE